MESTMRMSAAASSAAWSTSPRAVSASTSRSSPATRSRWARSFSCRTDSSPETYSTLPAAVRLPQSWSIRVDFPMPGAPPTSTREPFTAPPPSTRSSSPMPVEKRISSASSISGRATGRGPGPIRTSGRPAFPLGALSPSTMVFQAPQAGHFPAHLGVSLPHWVQ